MNPLKCSNFIGIVTWELLGLFRDGIEISWYFKSPGLCCKVRLRIPNYGSKSYERTWSSIDIEHCQDMSLMARVFVEQAYQAYAEIENKITYNRQKKEFYEEIEESNKRYR